MIATPRPTAVVTSASAMPADTVPMPPPPLVGSASFWNAVMMPPTVPNRPTARADDVRDRTAREALVEADRLAQPARALDHGGQRRDVETRLLAPAPEHAQPVARDGERVQRHRDQHHYDAAGDKAHLVPQSDQCEVHVCPSPCFGLLRV